MASRTHRSRTTVADPVPVGRVPDLHQPIRRFGFAGTACIVAAIGIFLVVALILVGENTPGDRNKERVRDFIFRTNKSARILRWGPNASPKEIKLPPLPAYLSTYTTPNPKDEFFPGPVYRVIYQFHHPYQGVVTKDVLVFVSDYDIGMRSNVFGNDWIAAFNRQSAK